MILKNLKGFQDDLNALIELKFKSPKISLLSK